jgi:hypothetical protein
MIKFILLIRLHNAKMFSIINELDIAYQLGLKQKQTPSINTKKSDQEINNDSFYKIIDEDYDKNYVLLTATRKEVSITELN